MSLVRIQLGEPDKTKPCEKSQGFLLGSSRTPGERGLDLEEEIGRVAESVDHAIEAWCQRDFRSALAPSRCASVRTRQLLECHVVAISGVALIASLSWCSLFAKGDDHISQWCQRIDRDIDLLCGLSISGRRRRIPIHDGGSSGHTDYLQIGAHLRCISASDRLTIRLGASPSLGCTCISTVEATDGQIAVLRQQILDVADRTVGRRTRRTRAAYRRTRTARLRDRRRIRPRDTESTPTRPGGRTRGSAPIARRLVSPRRSA